MPNVRIEPLVKKLELFDKKQLLRTIENAGNESSKAVQVDFYTTTRTWTRQPKFSIKHQRNSGQWDIGTDDEIYGYIDEGTKPHIIRPRNKKALSWGAPFKAKTRPGYIGSNMGRRGKKRVTRKIVHHPGIRARGFVRAINDKWEDEWPRQLGRAIRATKRYG